MRTFNKTYNKKCEICGAEFQSPTAKPKVCSKVCRKVEFQRRKGFSAGLVNHTCKICGVVFAARYHPVFCSDECRRTDNRIRSRETWKERYRPVPQITKACAHCGSIFSGPKNKTVCSGQCGWRHHAETHGAQPITEWKHGHCADCGNSFERRNPKDKYCVECKTAGNKQRRKIRWMLINGRKQTIKNTDVFERDGWRCYICGTETPKEARGRFLHNSPELDHILPISKGGPHNYWNVACACTKCNRTKHNFVTMPCRIVTEEGYPLAA